MDKNAIRQHLQTIAQEEIPNVDLWNDIEKQLTKPIPRSKQLSFSAVRYLAVIAAVLMFTMVGYAYYVYQAGISDATIPSNYITYLGFEQTIDEVTVTLDWAYVDAHRITIAYTTSRPANVALQDNPSVTLLNDNLTFQPFGGGGGGGGGSDPNAPIVTSALAAYMVDEVLNVSENLDFSLYIEYNSANNLTMNQSMGGSGGGGGGGGSGGAPENAASPEPTLDPMSIPTRVFEFEFIVPFFGEKDGLITSSQLNESIAFQVNELKISPSMMAFELCYDLPTAENWLPTLTVYTDAEVPPYLLAPVSLTDLDGRVVYMATAFEDFQYDFENLHACGKVLVAAPFTTDKFEIMLDYLAIWRGGEVIADEMLSAEAAFFAERGIEYTLEISQDADKVYAANHADVIYPTNGTYYLLTLTKYPETLGKEVTIQYLYNHLFRTRYMTEARFIGKIAD